MAVPHRVYRKRPHRVPESVGWSRYALEFDQTVTDQRVEVADSTSISNIKTGLSIVYWVNRYIIWAGYHVLKTDAFGGLKDQAEAGNKFLFFTAHLGGNDLWVITTNNLPPNEFHHVALTWEAGTKRAYIDGSLIAEDDARRADNLLQNTAAPIYIGNSMGWHATDFDGMLDGVLIYNRALSAREIRYLMRNYHNPIRSGLVLWLPLKEGLQGLDTRPVRFTDDFPGNALDTTQWTVGSGTATVANSICHLFDAGAISRIQTDTTYLYGDITFYAKLTHFQNLLGFWTPPPGDNYVRWYQNNFSCKKAGAVTHVPVAVDYNTYHYYRILWSPEVCRMWIDGDLKAEITTNIITSARRISCYTAANEHLYVDSVELKPPGLIAKDLSGNGNDGNLFPIADPPTWTRVQKGELRSSVM